MTPDLRRSAGHGAEDAAHGKRPYGGVEGGKMSGGHFFYHDSSLCEEVTGYYPDYGLDTTSVKEDAKNAMRDNRLEDSQISEA